jgi:hypothetical protein
MVGLGRLVWPLGLPNRLWVDGGHECVVDVHVGADLTPESAVELRSVVGDNTVWYAMLENHVLDKPMCPFWRVDIL